ncbi:MAG: NAD(+) diphosphatase, partial [Armatimonadota bacterium]|nr:NAD(+) diphosphatase [Armatimonadota bacterium]
MTGAGAAWVYEIAETMVEFVTATGPAPEDAEGWWFLFQGSRLLTAVREGSATLPHVGGPRALGLATDTAQRLGWIDGVPCYVGGFDEAPSPLPPGFEWVNLRELFGVLPDPWFAAATRAAHLAQWSLVHRYCGRCAAPLFPKEDELARGCTACGQVYYPQIAPAVIVAVHRGEKILLARSPRFPPGRRSVLAGFVEPGESLEECARREIREEVGIEVHNLRYFGSQPWPYPNSLMLG